MYPSWPATYYVGENDPAASLFVFIGSFYIMHVSVSPACMCNMCTVSMQFPQRPEEGVRSLGNGVAGVLVSHYLRG